MSSSRHQQWQSCARKERTNPHSYLYYLVGDIFNHVLIPYLCQANRRIKTGGNRQLLQQIQLQSPETPTTGDGFILDEITTFVVNEENEVFAKCSVKRGGGYNSQFYQWAADGSVLGYHHPFDVDENLHILPDGRYVTHGDGYETLIDDILIMSPDNFKHYSSRPIDNYTHLRTINRYENVNTFEVDEMGLIHCFDATQAKIYVFTSTGEPQEIRCVDLQYKFPDPGVYWKLVLTGNEYYVTMIETAQTAVFDVTGQLVRQMVLKYLAYDASGVFINHQDGRLTLTNSMGEVQESFGTYRENKTKVFVNQNGHICVLDTETNKMEIWE